MWFGVCYILFFLANTFTNIPYDAMAPELTDDQADRSLLFMVCQLFDGLGALCAIALPVGVQFMVKNYRGQDLTPGKSIGQAPTAPQGPE